MSKTKASPIVGIILVLMTACLAVGIFGFAAPATTDGLLAQRVIAALCVVLGIISLVRVFETDEGERRGLSLGAALIGALIACTPTLVLPANEAFMTPFVLCLGIAIALIGGIDLVLRLPAIGKD